jgi:hypothetical protein
MRTNPNLLRTDQSLEQEKGTAMNSLRCVLARKQCFDSRISLLNMLFKQLFDFGLLVDLCLLQLRVLNLQYFSFGYQFHHLLEAEPKY